MSGLGHSVRGLIHSLLACRLCSRGGQAWLPPGMGGISSPTRDGTRVPSIVRCILFKFLSFFFLLLFLVALGLHCCVKATLFVVA